MFLYSSWFLSERGINLPSVTKISVGFEADVFFFCVLSFLYFDLVMAYCLSTLPSLTFTNSRQLADTVTVD